MRQIYLLSTEHLEDGLWFRDEEDFRVGMNYVAIEAARQPAVAVLSFILMSNHVHFVLKGTRETVVAFVTQLKHRYSIYYRLKYGVKEFLRRNGLDVKQIPYDDEMRERTMAYVIMNCVAANICVHPSQYPWGTGTTFFNPAKPSGKCLGDMSGRARKAMLHSVDCDLPEDWLVNESGYILPEAYVDVRFVEALFRSPQRMHYFLMNSSKARKRINTEDEKLPAFRDQTILQALPDLCRSLFQKNSFRELQQDERKEYARQIRYRFSADANQIARVCGVSYADAASLLDQV